MSERFGEKIITTDCDESFVVRGSRLIVIEDEDFGTSNTLTNQDQAIRAKVDPLLENLPVLNSIPSVDELLGN